MAGTVYFGNKDKQSWIKAPASGMKASNVGWVAETQLLNGRAAVRRSMASHRRFEPTWRGSMNSADEASLQTIKNYAMGLYGDGPFYFLDPFTLNQNVMPEAWAAPMLAANDWPKLDDAVTVTFTAASVQNDYPVKYATYAVATDNFVGSKSQVIIIPEGYKLHFGWHGPSGSSDLGVRIVPYLRSTGAAATALNPTRLNAGGTRRTNTSVNGNTYSHVEIFLAIDTAADIDITAMIAQVLPEELVPETGGFIPGKGTTALEFASHPDIDYYSSEINEGHIGMSTVWVEV